MWNRIYWIKYFTVFASENKLLSQSDPSGSAFFVDILHLYFLFKIHAEMQLVKWKILFLVKKSIIFPNYFVI